MSKIESKDDVERAKRVRAYCDGAREGKVGAYIRSADIVLSMGIRLMASERDRDIAYMSASALYMVGRAALENAHRIYGGQLPNQAKKPLQKAGALLELIRPRLGERERELQATGIRHMASRFAGDVPMDGGAS